MRVKRGLKLRLLALVLALLLLWYCVNPAPYRVARPRPKEKEPDEKRREARPAALNTAALSFNSYGFRPTAISEAETLEEDDDFEWPEFIDG